MLKSAEQIFVEFLWDNGLSMTPQRKAITETFLETEGHFSAEELCTKVRTKMPDLGQATLYRTLKLLVDSGLADSLDPGNGAVLYEHRYGHAHHDHLICLNCGKKVEIYDNVIETRQEEVAADHGFELTRHRMYLYGLCPDCQSEKQ